MATSTTFTLRFNGVAHIVKRKFFLNKRSINFVEFLPASPDSPKSKAWHYCRQLPSSPYEVECFPGMQKALENAAQQFDNGLLPLPKLNADNPSIRTVEELRAHAKDNSTAKGQGRRFDEVSKALTGLTHSPLIEKLRAHAIEEFHAAFQCIRLYDPSEPEAAHFIFGYDVFAEEPVIATLRRLAVQGHAYSQFLSALLAASNNETLTSQSVQFFLAAHDQGLPQALPALAERLLLDRYYSDALQCAVIAVAGGYAEASSIIDDVGRATFHVMLETPRGLINFFQYLVEVEIEPGVRELLMAQRPEWRPKTHEQILTAMFGRQLAGTNHV